MKEKNGIKNIWILLIGVIALNMLNPTAVFADGISDAMQKVINVYPNSCSYFTSDGKSDSNSSDSRCSLNNIPSRGGLPSGKTVRDARGGDAWSCHGFAEYVWYVMFGHCTNTQAQTISASDLRVGDFIRFSGPHSAIYLGEDSKNYYVYDSNWAKPADNKVRYNHAISKDRGIAKCYHATNYDAVANANPENKYSKPDIHSTYWGYMTDTTFRLVVVIKNPETVKEVKFAVWSTGDQSDIRWYDANYNGVGDYFKDIKYSDFVNQHYFCHAYVYGNDRSTQVMALNDFEANKNKPTLSLLEKNGIFVASVFNTDHVTEYGFIYGNQADVTLETSGRTRIVYSELDVEGCYSLDTAELTGCMVRAYAVYADENGRKQVAYSESIVR